MESSKETGCQAPEGPILCINNCGFFGSAATMNMCSKCHKEMMLKQEQAKLAASSIENIVNGSSSNKENEHVATGALAVQATPVDLEVISTEASPNVVSGQGSEVKVKEGPNRCTTCRKRVGLTGFNCRCGNLFCAVHRYSDKHECPFDYRTTARGCNSQSKSCCQSRKARYGVKHYKSAELWKSFSTGYDCLGLLEYLSYLCWLDGYLCGICSLSFWFFFISVILMLIQHVSIKLFKWGKS